MDTFKNKSVARESAESRSLMFEALEQRQMMSVTLVGAPASSTTTDGHTLIASFAPTRTNVMPNWDWGQDY